MCLVSNTQVPAVPDIVVHELSPVSSQRRIASTCKCRQTSVLTKRNPPVSCALGQGFTQYRLDVAVCIPGMMFSHGTVVVVVMYWSSSSRIWRGGKGAICLHRFVPNACSDRPQPYLFELKRLLATDPTPPAITALLAPLGLCWLRLPCLFFFA